MHGMTNLRRLRSGRIINLNLVQEINPSTREVLWSTGKTADLDDTEISELLAYASLCECVTHEGSTEPSWTDSLKHGDVVEWNVPVLGWRHVVIEATDRNVITITRPDFGSTKVLPTDLRPAQEPWDRKALPCFYVCRHEDLVLVRSESDNLWLAAIITNVDTHKERTVGYRVLATGAIAQTTVAHTLRWPSTVADFQQLAGHAPTETRVQLPCFYGCLVNDVIEYLDATEDGVWAKGVVVAVYNYGSRHDNRALAIQPATGDDAFIYTHKEQQQLRWPVL